MTECDHIYMKMALDLAAKAKERTYPNPMVGAVILKRGKVIGRGYHKKAGREHAEVNAIAGATENCSGSTMYVTLEPCDSYGRTPPCTQSIIESGIKCVKIAMNDPNPENHGKGVRRLKKAGIKVEKGLLAGEARFLNRKYEKFITTALPYVTIKLAQSADGRIAARNGSSKWISSSLSREYVKEMRKNFDAVLVGKNTVMRDDPMLLGKGRSGRQPCRVFLDSRLEVPLDARMIRSSEKVPVIIGTTDLASRKKASILSRKKGLDLIKIRQKNKRVSLKPFLKKLAERGIVNLLVEGGGKLAGSFIDEGLADEVILFIAPVLLGGKFLSIDSRGVSSMDKVFRLKPVETEKHGEDIVMKGIICSPE